MSLYLCPACGFTDNTAGSGFHEQRRVGVDRPVCSSCNPDVETSSARLLNLRPEEPVSDPIPDLLRRAANKLDELNACATWEGGAKDVAGFLRFVDDRVCAPNLAALMAVLPGTAAPLAEWLRQTVSLAETHADRHVAEAQQRAAGEYLRMFYEPAIAVARAIVGEEEPRG